MLQAGTRRSRSCAPIWAARAAWARRNPGVQHWWAERVTAIALVPLTLWFIYAVLHLAGRAAAGGGAFRGASPVNTVLLLALVAMTFHHMQLGLQVVIEDYIEGRRRRRRLAAE